MKYLSFFFVSLSLAACGERGSSSQDQSASNAKLGYSDGFGNTSALPGIEGTALGGSSSAGANALQGSSSDGGLNAAETQALMGYVNDLSSEQRSSMQTMLLNFLRQCTFPAAGASTVASCRSGNGQACAQMVAGYAMGYLQANAQKLGLSGADMALLNSQTSMCAALDLSNQQAVQTQVRSKTDSCKRGSHSSCMGLLAILSRLFMKALALAFGLLKI